MAGRLSKVVLVNLLLMLHCRESQSNTANAAFLPTPSSQGTMAEQQQGCCKDDPENTPGRPTNPSLRKIVPAGYDPYILPKGLDGGPLPIYISAKVRDIQKIDETNMELVMEWFIRLYWRDPGLNWPTHLKNGTWLNISPDIVDYVWLPTTYVDHVKEITKPSLLIRPESFRMLNHGLIRYSMSVTTRVSCPMDFTAYPFDTQVCYFRMESYQFDTSQVTYEWFNPVIERSKTIQLGQFDFDFYSVKQQNTTHGGRKFPTVMVEVLLNRRVSYHLMNTFLPSGLFVMVSWLTFLVPVHMIPGRMVLTITTLLTMVSMFASVRQESPKVSYAKAVDQWMIMCIIFVFMVLVEFTVAIYLNEKVTQTKGKHSDDKGKKEDKTTSMHSTKDAVSSPMFTNLGQRTSTEATDGDFDGTGQLSHPSDKAKKSWKLPFSDLKPPLRVRVRVKPEGADDESTDDYKYWLKWYHRIEGRSPLVFFLVFVICNLSYWSYWIRKRGVIHKGF